MQAFELLVYPDRGKSDDRPETRRWHVRLRTWDGQQIESAMPIGVDDERYLRSLVIVALACSKLGAQESADLLVRLFGQGAATHG